MTATRAALIAIAIAAATLVGCSDPYAAAPPRGPSLPPPGELTGTTTARAPTTTPSPPAAGPDTPQALISRAVGLTGNWTGTTVVARYRQFVRLTTGTAHEEAASAAARLGTDPQLTATDTTSSATLASVTLTGTVRRKRAILVTHETLTSAGRTTSSYRVTLAQLHLTDAAGWLLADWQPQP